MKIITKQKLGFRNPATSNILAVEPFAIVDLPDWGEKDPMFELGRKAGLIELVNTDKIEDNTNKIEEESKPKSKSKKKQDEADKQEEPVTEEK